MSNMKNGFSTLNRWLGKRNKEKSPAPNGKLSKSNTNLSISTTNISETSQLEYNRIAPLPAITSNAPFEQTFRITVLLPKDQLYVARLGARVPLSKLLELACDHKSLDPEKYEFRNPVDPSQIYSCDLTIGAVGLCEIRLCHKSDSYDSFNADEVIKLHRTSVIRDSLSSSEFSSRNSKHTTKTASPYSSSNSLNSMDSTGMNYTRTPISPPPVLPKSTPPKMAAPPRKKRAAPRPPSQIVIPEKAALVIEQQSSAQTEQTIETLKQQQQEMMSLSTRKDCYASTPNLSSNVDANGNSSTTEETTINGNRPNRLTIANGNTIEYSDCEYAQIVKKNARNLHGGSVQNLSTDGLPSSTKLPEPSPRKRLVILKKKAAPAPPPRNSSISGADHPISTASTMHSTPVTPNTADSEKSPEFDGTISYSEKEKESTTVPKPITRETEPLTKQPLQSSTPVSEKNLNIDKSAPETSINIPKPVPRQTTTTLLNVTPIIHTVVTQNINVSKVLLNRSPTPTAPEQDPEPEPQSLASDSSETTERLLGIQHISTQENDDNISKQADSGIGEPVPSPLPDSLPSEGSAHECKSTFESSSDDDEIIKTYNFKLGKTIVKDTDQTSTTVNNDELTTTVVSNPNTATPGTSSSWNFSIPISPPPNFADAFANQQEPTSTDAPITPKIVERPVLNFENMSTIEIPKNNTTEQKISPLPSPSSPINEIIDELSTILNENRMDSLIKRHDEQPEIQSAKPNTLTNFTISTLTTQQVTSTTVETPVSNEPITKSSPTPDSVSDEDKLYRKRGSSSSVGLKQLKSVERADSFHTTSAVNGTPSQCTTVTDSSNGLNSRSASYLSLSKLDQNGGLNRRRSSSELSIGESPSLQSLEIIKTILNSRKNSLANSSDGESKTANAQNMPNIDFVNRGRETSNQESKTTNIESKVTETISTQSTKSKEPPKIYRYSGPPSINFSTWTERPKVQVAIKNEGDYIFGGKNAGNQNAAVSRADVELRSLQSVPRQQRSTMHILNSEEPKSIPPAVTPKPTIQTSTTERMGIPEKEYHIPLTVKPLKDVTIEDVVTRTTPKTKTTTTQINTEQNISKTILINGTTTTTSGSSQHQITQLSHTSTLPRAGHNSTNCLSISAKPATGVNLLRSTSITQLEQRNSQQNNTTSTNITAPFGQNTLRKTGLKEKILAKEEEAQNQQTNITVNSTNSNAVLNGKMLKPNLKTSSIYLESTNNRGGFSKSKQSLQSAKLELKLKDPTEMGMMKKINISRPQSPRAITPKSAPPAPIPPVPPMPMLKSVTLRSHSTTTATTPTNGDQRDALLEAIRNFKRTELNRI